MVKVDGKTLVTNEKAVPYGVVEATLAK